MYFTFKKHLIKNITNFKFHFNLYYNLPSRLRNVLQVSTGTEGLLLCSHLWQLIDLWNIAQTAVQFSRSFDSVLNF